jgi:tetratricopeptide (TPR) repeat protein
MLGQVNRLRNRNPQAIAYFQRALRAAEASGRRLPESRYRVALALAEQVGQRPVAVEFARQLVAAYPSPINWRDALMVFRTVAPIDATQNLDAMRLMRASGALAGERDYMALATALDQAALPGEVKAVLDEGVARGMISAADAAPRALLLSANQRITRERAGLAGRLTQARAATATGEQARTTADLLFGYGRYAEAAELYRLALTRVGEDPGLLNTRLGASLALAGQRAEAEAALRAVTGPRAELAGLWLAWVARPVP